MGIPSHAIVSGNEILEYIPQRAPIVMVDKFFGIEGVLSFSGFTVKADTIFVEKNVMNESGIVEHIAQSCALRVGYFCKQQNVPVPVGFIAAIKNMVFHQLPKVGDELFTTVKIDQEVFDITLISAEARCREELVASCEMKIFLKK